MLRHRWKILIGVAAVFVLLTGIELATIGNGPKREVEAYKKALIAQGEKLEISELIPPPVPVEQNGADTVNQAFGLLTPEDKGYAYSVPAMRLIAPGKAIVCFEQPEVRDFRLTNSWEDEMNLVEDDRSMLELLRRAATYPAIDFHLDYTQDVEKQMDEDMQYAGQLRNSVRRLAAAAICDLHAGDAVSAVTNICAILALVNGEKGAAFPGFPTRVGLSGFAANVNWELLQSSNVNDQELALLQSRWERLEFIHVMEERLARERAIFESEIEKIRASDEYFNHITRGAKMDVDWSVGWYNAIDALLYNARLTVTKSMYLASWTYSDELGMLKEHEIRLQTLRMVETNQIFFPAYTNMLDVLRPFEADDPNRRLIKLDDTDLHRMFSGMMSVGDDPVSRTAGAEATRRMVVTAIALKRYQLKHGKYPAALAGLVPGFVSSVPRDPIDGKPLRYRLKPDGSFLLYSIGLNGKDDGGDGSTPGRTGRGFPRLTSPDALDWVWPQPATPAEIQFYYAHYPGP